MRAHRVISESVPHKQDLIDLSMLLQLASFLRCGQESKLFSGLTTFYAFIPHGIKASLCAKGLSFVSNRQRLKEGTLCASELAGIEPTPAYSRRAGYARLNLCAISISLE
jgi:hypothetical protein